MDLEAAIKQLGWAISAITAHRIIIACALGGAFTPDELEAMRAECRKFEDAFRQAVIQTGKPANALQEIMHQQLLDEIETVFDRARNAAGAPPAPPRPDR